MPKSKVNPNLEIEYDEHNWIISILNAGRGFQNRWIDGHAVIVVEGIKEEKPFINEYSISVEAFPEYQTGVAKIKTDVGAHLSNLQGPKLIGSSINTGGQLIGGFTNTKGYIHRILAFGLGEIKPNTRNYEREKNPVISYPATAIAAENMLLSIRNDIVRFPQGKENFDREQKGLSPMHFDEQGKPIQAVKYQKLGKDHFLVKFFVGDPNAGENCAGWVIDKLKHANIYAETLVPKPKVLTGQCSFFSKSRLALTGVGIAIATVATGGIGLFAVGTGAIAGLGSSLAIEKSSLAIKKINCRPCCKKLP